MNNTSSPYMSNLISGVTESLNSAAKGELTIKSATDNMLSGIGKMINFPNSEQLATIDWSSIKSIISVLGTTIILILCSVIVLYILKGIALYTINKKHDDKFAWLSFIPYGCFYALGKAVGKTKLYGIEVENPEFLIPGIVLAGIFPYTQTLCVLLFILAFYGLLYRLYQNKVPSFAIVLLILSILLPILPPFFIFAIRKK